MLSTSQKVSDFTSDTYKFLPLKKRKEKVVFVFHQHIILQLYSILAYFVKVPFLKEGVEGGLK